MKAGLRARLALRASLLASVAVALVATAVEFGLLRPLEARDDERLRATAEGLAGLVAEEGARALDGAPADDSWAIVVSAGGGLLGSRGRAAPTGAAAVLPGRAATLRGAGGESSRAVAVPVPGKDTVLVAGISLLDVRLRQAEYRVLLAAGCLVSVLLVGAGAWFSASLVLDPIGEMTATGRRLSGERADLRLPVRGTGDELDGLAALLNDMLAHLGGALEDERRFSADAAHELRAPLALLRLRAVEAAGKGDLAAMREALGATVEDADRVARLVEALLRFARSPGPAGDPFDAGKAVGALAEDLRMLADGVGLALEVPPAPGPLPVSVPPEVLETCVSILVDNAFRYTPRGGRVEIRLAREEDCLVVRVADSGPGIAADEAEQVFERLFRGAAGRAAGPGFGLGLALARRLARASGGDVVLENPGGPGARMALRIPLAA